MASKNSSWLGALVLLVAVGACSDSSRAPDEAGRIGAVSAALTSCDSLPEWTVKSYSGGDRVKHGGSVYECRAWPYSGWCGEVGYEPGVTIHWQNAWLLIDTCSSGTGGSGGGGGGAGSGGVGAGGAGGGAAGASGNGGTTGGTAPTPPLQPTVNDPNCIDGACCEQQGAVTLTAAVDTYNNSSASACLVALGGSDVLFSAAPGVVVAAGEGDDTISSGQYPAPGVGVPPVRVLGGPGNDTISGWFDHAEIYGGAGDDTISGGPGPVVIVPGSGQDTAESGDGDDTFVLFAECEATSGKHLAGGAGYDTLISPLSLQELAARGVLVESFENVVIQGDACKSDCTSKPTCGPQTRCVDQAGLAVCAAGDGGPCSVAADCDGDLTCADGACRPICGASNQPGCVPDCQAECAARACGDDRSTACGASCVATCDDGEAGCQSNADCRAGSICGRGIGARFGMAATANVCWPAVCAVPSFNYAGFLQGGRPAACGTPSACVPDCSGNRLEDGCGGLCFVPTAHQLPGPAGAAFSPIPMIPRGGGLFPEPLPPRPTAVVGALAGALRVTDRGTASYTIPIEVPPGRLGLEPELSLSYLGTKVNGMLGVGWAVTGLSSITRCRTTHAQATELRPVLLDDQDRFCLDGETLIQVHASSGPSYGGDGAEYVLERDTTKLRITSHSDQGIRTGYFTALTRDGRTLTFGRNTGTVVASNGVRRVWALEEVEDSAQNFMSIRYLHGRTGGVAENHGPADNGQRDTGELLPRLISYGGSHVAAGSQAAQDATRFVYLTYEPRTNPAFHYVAGEPGYSTMRITSVQTFVQDTKVKTYKIKYAQDSQTGEFQNVRRTDLFAPQHVDGVQECANDLAVGGGAEVCKPATKFEYVDASGGYKQEYPLATVSPHASGLIVLDANGDGKDDLLSIAPNGATSFLSTWSGPNPLQAQANVAFVDQGIPLPPGNGPCLTQSSVIDLNRDGKDDLISVCRAPSNLQILYSEAGPSTWPWRQEDIAVPMVDAWRTFLGDYDGDGLRDLFVCRDSRATTIHRNTGSTFVTAPLDTIPGTTNCHVTALDVDGDGDDDLVEFRNSLSVWRPGPRSWEGMGTNVPWYNHLVLDFNGDGLNDFVSPDLPFDASNPTAHERSAMRLWLNTAKGFSEQVADVADSNGGYGFKFAERASDAAVLDVDGDGSDDIVLPSAAPGAPVDAFVAVVRFVDQGHAQLDALEIPWQHGLSLTLLTADLNGDGASELVFQRPGTASLSFAPGVGGVNLLQRVRDGLGRQDEVEYGGDAVRFRSNVPMRTYSPGQCGDSTSFTCLRRVAPLVSAHSTSQVDLLTSEKKLGVRRELSYSGAVIQAGAHGWIGFKQRVVEIPNHSLTTIDYVTDNFRYAGLPLRVAVQRTNEVGDYSSAGTRTHVIDYAWVTANFQSTNPDAPRFPFLQLYTETLFSNASFLSRKQTFNAVDGFNNVIMSSTAVITPTALVSQMEVEVPRLNDVYGRRVGLPDYVETHSTRGGHEQVRKTAFGYDARGLLTSVTRQPDDPSSTVYQQTVLTPNEFGVVDSECVITSAGTAEQRCVSVDLDDWSIYPQAVTELGASLTTEYVFGAEGGELLVKTEPSGVATELAYDAFGRLSYVHGPTREGPVDYLPASLQSSGFPEVKVWGALLVASQFKGEGTTATTYDAFGRPVQTRETGLDGTVVFSESLYDELGRVAVESLPHAAGSMTQGLRHFDYSTNGTLKTVVDPDGSATHVEIVDPESVLSPYAAWFQDDDTVEATVVRLPRGNQKVSVYDAAGNVVRTFDDPNGVGGTELSTHFEYGEFDTLRQVTTPKDTTQFYPDAIGRPETVTATVAGARIRAFSGFDEVVSEMDGNGDTFHYVYDGVGRLIEQLDAGAATVAKWEYDGAVGRGVGEPFREFRRSSPNSTSGTWTEYEYESGSRGRPVRTSYRVGADIASPSVGGELFHVGVTYKFAAPGQIDRISYPNNAGDFVVQQDYDAGGNLRGVSAPGQGGLHYWRLLTADEGLRPKSELFGNGVETLRSYHRLGEVDPGCVLDPNQTCLPGRLSNIHSTAPGGAVLQDIFLSHDRNGNVLSLHEGSGPGTRLFDYDGQDRLVRERLSSQGVVSTVKEYHYNALGNMTSQTGLPSFVYDSETTRLSSVGATEYDYDGNGNQVERVGPLVAGGYQKLDLNELEMPWHVTQGEGSLERDVFLEYDAGGQRIVKRELLPGGSEKVTITIGDLYERVTTPSGTEHHYKVRGGKGQAAEVVRQEGSGAESVTYLHDDHLGSVRLLTDASGSTIESRGFDPFGKETSPIDWAATDIKGGFTGHSQDDDLGLVNMKGRLFDPIVGRFISADPFVANPLSALGWDRYAYVEGNPLRFVDPSGYEPRLYQVSGGGQTVSFMWGAHDKNPQGTANGGPGHTNKNTSSPGGGAGNPASVPTSMGPTAGPPGGGPAMGQPTLSNPGNRPASEEWPDDGAWRDVPEGPSISQPVPHALLSDPNFEIEDTSETWRTALEVAMILEAGWEIGMEVALSRAAAAAATRQVAKEATLTLCFIAGTLVAIPAGAVPIENLRVGDRVETVTGSNVTEVDLTWRVVKITLADERDLGHIFNVELLRPSEWFEAHDVRSTGDRVILDSQEIGVAGIGVVDAIEAAPEIHHGAGRVVLMTVNHVNSDVYELSFEGVVEQLRATGAHPLYSLERGAWVPVRDLVVGERLQTAEGAVSVAALERVRGEHRVFNIEVEAEHEYLVTSERIRAHNTCFTPAGRAITEHAEESLRRHGFKSLGQVDDIIEGARYTVGQENGATVFIQQIGRGGKASYNLVVEGAKGVVTGMRGLSKEAVRALGRNNGWDHLPF